MHMHEGAGRQVLEEHSWRPGAQNDNGGTGILAQSHTPTQ